MADLDKARENPREQLFDEIEGIHAGMLGVEGSGQHMQPMAPQLDRESGSLWFFTRRDSELALSVGTGSPAHFCVVGKGHDYHACLGGLLRENRDEKRIEAFWSPVVAAWFEKGKEDPDMTLLEFRPKDAAVWASTGNPVKFGWEIAKANMKEGEPEVGVRNQVIF